MGRPRPVTPSGDPAVQVTLRRATVSDGPLLMVWRNDPVVIRYSITRRGVTPAEHLEWLAARLSDPDRCFWIAEEGGTPVGQVRVDLDRGVGTVSIVIASDHRGRGVGSAVLRAMLVEMADGRRASRLRAEVEQENSASLRAFERTGFVRQGLREGGFVVFERSVGRRDDAGHNHRGHRHALPTPSGGEP